MKLDNKPIESNIKKGTYSASTDQYYEYFDTTNSSNITQVLYFENRHVMQVEFKRYDNLTSIYHYLNVPKKLFVDMAAADSAGKFLNAFVKPFYKCEKK